MGTKNNPGAYDCYDNADPDEPMFTLLARDRQAPDLIREWARVRIGIGDLEKAREAGDCAHAMERWRVENRPRSEYYDVFSERVKGKVESLVCHLHSIPSIDLNEGTWNHFRLVAAQLFRDMEGQ